MIFIDLNRDGSLFAMYPDGFRQYYNPLNSAGWVEDNFGNRVDTLRL